MSRDAPEVFTTVRKMYGGASGVALGGEADLAAVPDLEQALDSAIRDSAGPFVIDLCDLDFLDSCGLRVLLRARALLAREDREMAIACPPGSVRRLFDVAGVADLLFFYDSGDAVSAAIQPLA